ncbi:MAG: hypothetical protein V1750_03250 [Acidobacteriota bacterium]
MTDAFSASLSAVKGVPSYLRKNKVSVGLIAGTFVLALLAFVWKGYELGGLASVVIGDQGDTLTFTSLVYQAIDNLFHRPMNLGYGLFFFNDPSPLASTVAPYGLAVAVLPIYLLTGFDLELTMNIYILATFALTAWAVFLLARHLLRVSPAIGIIAGLAVAFSQFRFAHVVHIETLSTHFYLLCLYLLHRFIDEPCRKWAVWLGVMFWLTFFASGYMGYMFIVTAGLVLGAVFIFRREAFTQQLFRQALVALILTAVISLPFLSMRFQKADAVGGYSVETIQNYSATPATGSPAPPSSISGWPRAATSAPAANAPCFSASHRCCSRFSPGGCAPAVRPPPNPRSSAR